MKSDLQSTRDLKELYCMLQAPVALIILPLALVIGVLQALEHTDHLLSYFRSMGLLIK